MNRIGLHERYGDNFLVRWFWLAMAKLWLGLMDRFGTEIICFTAQGFSEHKPPGSPSPR